MPTGNLNVAMLPLDIRLGDIRHNVAVATERIENLPPETDLVVLPELFNTGFGDFSEDPHFLAESDDGFTVSTMCALSKRLDIAIAGGFIGKADDRLFNRAFIIADGVPLAFYNKRHLFAGPEQKIFTRGEQISPVVNVKGWNLRLAICYDLRFPVWNRSINLDYDGMIVVANWPNSRYYAWSHLVIARAIENQCYIAACNREGEDIYGLYARGDSMIVNAMGYPVGHVADDGTVTGVLDGSSLETDRKRLKPYLVADDFTLHL